MPQIALVTNQHDNNVGISMVPQLLQPPRNVLVGLVLADVIDQQRSNSTSVVCRCDGSVSLLSCGIPNLSLDCLRIDLDGPGRKLDTNGGLGI